MRPLSGFVMVLAYSRALFALFTVDQTLESFLRGHVEAFQAWPGVPRTLFMCPRLICGGDLGGASNGASFPLITAT